MLRRSGCEGSWKHRLIPRYCDDDIDLAYHSETVKCGVGTVIHARAVVLSIVITRFVCVGESSASLGGVLKKLLVRVIAKSRQFAPVRAVEVGRLYFTSKKRCRRRELGIRRIAAT